MIFNCYVELLTIFTIFSNRLDNNDYKCEKCRSVSQATKQFNIEMAPIVLCLQLKRFPLFGGKINKPVHCNRTLDLTRFQHSSIRNHGVSFF